MGLIGVPVNHHPHSLSKANVINRKTRATHRTNAALFWNELWASVNYYFRLRIDRMRRTHNTLLSLAAPYKKHAHTICVLKLFIASRDPGCRCGDERRIKERCLVKLSLLYLCLQPIICAAAEVLRSFVRSLARTHDCASKVRASVYMRNACFVLVERGVQRDYMCMYRTSIQWIQHSCEFIYLRAGS